MGYDSNECLLCYFSRGNNCADNHGYVCLLCIDMYADSITSRVVSALENCLEVTDFNCARCNESRQIGFRVTLCNGCVGNGNGIDDNDDNDDQEEKEVK